MWAGTAAPDTETTEQPADDAPDDGMPESNGAASGMEAFRALKPAAMDALRYRAEDVARSLTRTPGAVLADLAGGSLVRDALLVVGGAGFVGLAAQVSVDLPCVWPIVTFGRRCLWRSPCMCAACTNTYIMYVPCGAAAGPYRYVPRRLCIWRRG